RIDKRWRRTQRHEAFVVHFHLAAAEIGDIQAGLGDFIFARSHVGDGEAFFNGARLGAGGGGGGVVVGGVKRDDPLRAHGTGRAHGTVEVRGRQTDIGVPADNRSILGCKEEDSRSRFRGTVLINARNREAYRTETG